MHPGSATRLFPVVLFGCGSAAVAKTPRDGDPLRVTWATTAPTRRPTTPPPMPPTAAPTAHPATSPPKALPSGVPSQRPTTSPTDSPLGRSADRPSDQPSNPPSSPPSMAPSLRMAPAVLPLSAVPYDGPSVSQEPTLLPSSSGISSSMLSSVSPLSSPSTTPTSRPTTSAFPSLIQILPEIDARESSILVNGPTKRLSTATVLVGSCGFMAMTLLGLLVHGRGARARRIKRDQAPTMLEVSFGGDSPLPSGSSDGAKPAPRHDLQEIKGEGMPPPSRDEQDITGTTDASMVMQHHVHLRSSMAGSTARNTRRKHVRFVEGVGRDDKDRRQESPGVGRSEPSECFDGSGWPRPRSLRCDESSDLDSQVPSDEESLESSNWMPRSPSESGSSYFSDEDTQEGIVIIDWLSCGSCA